MQRRDGRVPVLYLAPWVDLGGADKGTLDWFRFLDRSRFAPSLITTQPSANRRLAEVEPYAEEVWELPQLMRGDDFPRFIFAFVESRGVELVHIMNSRLGFDLTPWMATLAHRPRVVVQLHVDEPDRSLYVRYVTTRYGNLVDMFSLSSEALSERVAAYGVAEAKRRLIRTGVDAEREFCPAHATPIEGLDRDRLQILFPARLTAQKDPLLMVDVAARLRDVRVPFQIHVLGDGDLAEPLGTRIASLRLEDEVVLHGGSLEVARWYAACDVVLLTSQFEGLPYVAYEAMAMRLPVVMPRLPGLDELVTPQTGVLISDSRRAEPYAAAIAELAAAPALRAQLGEAARARVLAEFSLERMGREHGALYDELLEGNPRPRKPQPSPNGRSASPKSTRVAFRGRRPGSHPLVSLIVPCFNHGAFLPECLDSIVRQRYQPIETIVADDGSTDPDTLAALERIERDRPVSVVRLPANRGPGAARNAAIGRANGRYVLPLDADNLLFPTAVRDLVAQLNNAGEQIGFVYPHLQYFGDRYDVRVAPSYNLHGLLASNHCDTASLIDREVFDHGLRYSEYDGLIHEDWDFVLALAERGIYGEPARNVTVLSRKRGFTRSDLVNLSAGADQVVARQHSALLGEVSRIKAEWNPSLTVIALDPVAEPGEEDPVPELVAAAQRQTCADFELIIATERELWPTEMGPRLRRVSAALTHCRAEALTQGIKLARGGYLLAAYGSVTKLLADRTMIEKLLRLHESNRELAAVALADPSAGHPRLRLLDPDEPERAVLGALCWSVSEPGSAPPCDRLPGDQPLEALARRIGFDAHVQWRYFSANGVGSPRTGVVEVRFAAPRDTRRAEGLRGASAMLPRCPPAIKAALGGQGPWMPPDTRLLYRHLDKVSGRYTCSVGPDTRLDGSFSHVLGAIRASPLPGTRALCLGSDGAPLVGAPAASRHARVLGFIEQTQLPMLDELSVGRHRETGQRVLVAGPTDPLAGAVDDPAPIGFVEPCPIRPQTLPDGEVFYGLLGLVRTVDRSARRHRYGAGAVPEGVRAGELGSLLRDSGAECEPLWIDDHGSAFWPGQPPGDRRPSLVDAMRWTVAPMTWGGFSPPGPRLRSTARRAYDSAVVFAPSRTNHGRPATPAGYLLRSPAPYTVPLYGAIHPVTADRLLSTVPSEAAALGYRDAVLLGHLVARAPITGQLGPIRPAAAWTNRFGMLTGAG